MVLLNGGAVYLHKMLPIFNLTFRCCGYIDCCFSESRFMSNDLVTLALEVNRCCGQLSLRPKVNIRYFVDLISNKEMQALN